MNSNEMTMHRTGVPMKQVGGILEIFRGPRGCAGTKLLKISDGVQYFLYVVVCSLVHDGSVLEVEGACSVLDLVICV